MPARDFLHNSARNALVNDGWTITHDPYRISYGFKDVYVDLGAEPTLGAEKGGLEIAVEIKGFRGRSELRDFEDALGQLVLYRSWMTRVDPNRRLYLAASEDVYDLVLSELFARTVLEDLGLPLIIFRPDEERIVRWIA